MPIPEIPVYLPKNAEAILTGPRSEEDIQNSLQTNVVRLAGEFNTKLQDNESTETLAGLNPFLDDIEDLAALDGRELTTYGDTFRQYGENPIVRSALMRQIVTLQQQESTRPDIDSIITLQRNLWLGTLLQLDQPVAGKPNTNRPAEVFTQMAQYYLNIGEENDVLAARNRPTTPNEPDELIDEARMITAEDGKISTSLLQRRLRISYVRAQALAEALKKGGDFDSRLASEKAAQDAALASAPLVADTNVSAPESPPERIFSEETQAAQAAQEAQPVMTYEEEAAADSLNLTKEQLSGLPKPELLQLIRNGGLSKRQILMLPENDDIREETEAVNRLDWDEQTEYLRNMAEQNPDTASATLAAMAIESYRQAYVIAQEIANQTSKGVIELTYPDDSRVLVFQGDEGLSPNNLNEWLGDREYKNTRPRLYERWLHKFGFGNDIYRSRVSPLDTKIRDAHNRLLIGDQEYDIYKSLSQTETPEPESAQVGAPPLSAQPRVSYTGITTPPLTAQQQADWDRRHGQIAGISREDADLMLAAPGLEAPPAAATRDEVGVVPAKSTAEVIARGIAQDPELQAEITRLIQEHGGSLNEDQLAAIEKNLREGLDRFIAIDANRDAIIAAIEGIIAAPAEAATASEGEELPIRVESASFDELVDRAHELTSEDLQKIFDKSPANLFGLIAFRGLTLKQVSDNELKIDDTTLKIRDTIGEEFDKSLESEPDLQDPKKVLDETLTELKSEGITPSNIDLQKAVVEWANSQLRFILEGYASNLDLASSPVETGLALLVRQIMEKDGGQNEDQVYALHVINFAAKTMEVIKDYA